MHLSTIQVQLPWGMTDYSGKFRADPRPHKNFQHALLHVIKAAGKLAAIAEKPDHDEAAWPAPADVEGYLADLVICAARMANVNPGVAIDLEEAVIQRVKDKMGVDLTVREGEDIPF